MSQKKYDVVVIGLGAVGAATLFQLSKSNRSILGIDRFDPPHKMGSSHGETRITRLAVGESDAYVPMVMRSHEIWREIELLSNSKIFTQCGGILFDSGESPWSKHGSEGFLSRTVGFAEKYGINHKVFNAKQFHENYPLFQLGNKGACYFEPAAGYVRPEQAILSQLALAETNGAQILRNSPVSSILKLDNGLIKLNFRGGEVLTNTVINCSGGWIKDFVSTEERSNFKICRQVLHWIKIDSDSWKDSPVFMWGMGPDPEDFIYGFPSLDGKSIKVATESFISVDHPDLINREVSLEEQQIFWDEKINHRISGLKPEFLKSEVCFYTVTSDAKFVIKRNSEIPNEWIVSACSGHGFKHSAALGEYLADLVLERPTRFQL
ncbi:N-methyl-L-tryptophan oxidase [Algoriphagus sp. SE2]|uniref:N-methyl-L-tryptophan oxidase n=1 Tax=Algoriphagus sp. SE2 TaxID=3141536 RepID=UPI0031CD2E5C